MLQQLPCHWAIEIFRLYYNLMGPLSNTRSVVDRNGVPQRLSVSLCPGSCQGSTPNHFQWVLPIGIDFCSNELLNLPQFIFWKGLDQCLAISKCLLLQGLRTPPSFSPWCTRLVWFLLRACGQSLCLWGARLSWAGHSSAGFEFIKREIVQWAWLNHMGPSHWGADIKGRESWITWSKTGPVEGAMWQGAAGRL